MPVETRFKKEVNGMFCKFCGKQIDPSAHECPYCGELQEARSGGNGFWDILSPQQSAAELAAIMRQNSSNTQKKEAISVKKRSPYSYVTFWTVILGIVCTLGMGFIEFAALQNLTSEMHEAVRRSDVCVNELQEKLENIHKTVEEVRTETIKPPIEEEQAASKNTTITSVAADFLVQPHDACLQDGEATFSVEIQNADGTIWWEYRTANELWQQVPENGLTFHVETHDGKSEMQVKGQTDLGEMLFRCCIKVDEETVYSREVMAYLP